MIKILTASKDTYIQNRSIKNIDTSDANLGRAPTLDLFKLTKINKDNSITKEISRVLIKFNIDEIKTLVDSGKIDIESESFKSNLILKDIKSAQTLPNDFFLKIAPLKKDFDEGNGVDILSYDDIGVCNFFTASIQPFVTWSISGAASSGSFDSDVDQIITSGSTIFEVNQLFKIGNEDLNVDVTNVLKSQLKDEISNNGFIISFSGSIENDNNTYFVKRFASNQAYDTFYRPKLLISYDDSINDDLPYGLINTSGSTFLFNKNRRTGELDNILSGSTNLTGSNCILLNLKCKNTSSVSLFFSGSQIETGKYKCDFFVPDSGDITKILNASGSIKFVSKWLSIDKSIQFTEENEFNFSRGTAQFLGEDEISFNIKHLKSSYKKGEIVILPVFIYEKSFNLKLVKKPIEKKSLFSRELEYAIRDIETNETAIDFSEGTKLSNDTEKCFITLDTNNLVTGKNYVIDLKLKDGTNHTNSIIKNVSSIFKVSEK